MDISFNVNGGVKAAGLIKDFKEVKSALHVLHSDIKKLLGLLGSGFLCFLPSILSFAEIPCAALPRSCAEAVSTSERPQ